MVRCRGRNPVSAAIVPFTTIGEKIVSERYDNAVSERAKRKSIAGTVLAQYVFTVAGLFVLFTGCLLLFFPLGGN